jgi:hypothetical protein
MNVHKLLFQPIGKLGFLKFFVFALVLTAGIIFIFIRPGQLQAGDFMMIAWQPGQEILKTGAVHAEYPYPLWTALMMLPFAIGSPEMGALFLLIVNVMMLAASIALLVLLFDWELTPFLFVMTTLLCVLFLPILSSLWVGQLTIFSLLVLVLSVHFFLRERWAWLGIVLGLSFIKPQMMLLLAGLLLLWALWQRRWQVLIGFGGTMLIFVLISLPFMERPSQLIGGGIGVHLETFLIATSTIWGATMKPGLPWQVPFLISLGMMIWLGWVWLPFMQGKEVSNSRFLFLCSAAILVNLVVVPYSWMHNLTLMLLPFTYSLWLVNKMNGTMRTMWLTLLVFVTHPLMVLLFFMLSLPSVSQAYQGIPALILLPMMIFLEYKNNQAVLLATVS